MKLTAGRITAIGGLAATASMVLLMAGADAHHPEVSASSSCADGLARVRIDAVSWASDTPDHRYNANVSISFDGTTVGSGAFLPTNNFAFAITLSTAADGATHTVRATAVSGFGPAGEFGLQGEFREATVTLPANCTVVVTTTTTTATPGATTTTVAANSGVDAGTPTTTVPVIVGGTIETRPDIAPPIVVQPRFAG